MLVIAGISNSTVAALQKVNNWNRQLSTSVLTIASVADMCVGEFGGFGFMFDISLLRCFVTVAEERHFGRAAERMNMSQPPFSRQIQILEHVLAGKLLERTSRTVKVTPACQIFLPKAR